MLAQDVGHCFLPAAGMVLAEDRTLTIYTFSYIFLTMPKPEKSTGVDRQQLQRLDGAA